MLFFTKIKDFLFGQEAICVKCQHCLEDEVGSPFGYFCKAHPLSHKISHVTGKKLSTGDYFLE